ncbi:hypothetical protein Abr02nite_68230 [Paractinoplanes brasiliensis]|nr:hypothetical protein Abr02nite_68230 [Actinoplanes brasiliensis]
MNGGGLSRLGFDPSEKSRRLSDRVLPTATVPAARPTALCAASSDPARPSAHARRPDAPLPALDMVGTQTLRRSQNPADRNEEIHL